MTLTLSYKTYACKYLHLCPTLLTKFNSTHVKNLQYSICIIADVSGCYFFIQSSQFLGVSFVVPVLNSYTIISIIAPVKLNCLCNAFLG